MFSLYSKLKNKTGLLLQSYKRNNCKICHRTLNFFLKKNLLITNCISSGICMALGDIAQQEIEYRQKIETKRYDWERVWQMTIVGTTQGPPHHYFYLYLDKLFPVVNIKTVILKIVIDQLTISPFIIIFFFIGMGLLDKQPLTEIYNETTRKFIYVFLGDCLFWPPIQLINFYFLPTHLRVLYINLSTMIFNIFMSYMKHYDQHDDDDN